MNKAFCDIWDCKEEAYEKVDVCIGWKHSSGSETLKPFLHHGIERAERHKSHMTVCDWQGGGMSRGYHLWVSDLSSEIVIGYHRKMYDGYDEVLKPLQAIAKALVESGFEISVYDDSPFGNRTEGNEVVDPRNVIGIKFQ